MGWQDLLEPNGSNLVLPWIGGRILHAPMQRFNLKGPLPEEYGWFSFRSQGKRAFVEEASEPDIDILHHRIRGFAVGDRLIPDSVRLESKPIHTYSERVFCIPDGLERFSRIVAGRIFSGGPLLFVEEDFPLGSENEVRLALEEQQETLDRIRGVTPALEMAFRAELDHRKQIEERRQEIERQRQEEEAKQAREKLLNDAFGNGAIRRELVNHDFREAAIKALRVGGAVYLDHRKYGNNEWAVKYRVEGRRLECVCNNQLQIVDAGVCLTDHDTNEKGDTFFTLESLPVVIREAVRLGKLVVWRHV